MRTENYGIVIDIGGTTLNIAMYEIDTDFLITKAACYNVQQQVRKGKENLYNQIDKVIKTCKEKIKKPQRVNKIIIGCPGNFSRENYTLEKGSAKQLSHTKNEFDHINIWEYFHKLCQEETLYLYNDAKLQCIGGIICNNLREKSIGYIGIGTGLGGALCEISSSGKISFVGDGHISDLNIGNIGEKESRAEDHLSGRYIQNITTHSPKEINSSNQLLKKHRSLFEEMGITLADIIIRLQKKNIKKVKNKRAWSDETSEKISQCNTYLIGGSVANKGTIGKIIQQTAKTHLYKHSPMPIKLIALEQPDKVALTGGLYLCYEQC
ncbi:MAG: hypothetical protein VW378_01315 [bacterium]